MTRRVVGYSGAAVLVAAVAYSLSDGVLAGGHSVVRPRSPAAVVAVAKGGARRGRPPHQQSGQAGARSLTAAVDTAVAYLETFDHPVGYVSALSFFQQITLSPLTARAARGLNAVTRLQTRLADGGRGFLRGWMLGWQVVSFSSEAARVEIWTMGTVVSPVEALAPYWSTTTCVLRWSDDRWKLAAAHSALGPTPPSRWATGDAIESFVRSASSFHPFADEA